MTVLVEPEAMNCQNCGKAPSRPDYEAAELLFEPGADLDWLNYERLAVDVLVRKIVVAAIGDRFLIDPPTEEDR